MIYVFITKNEQGQKKKVSVNGHAGYSEKGKDIVCAGVSALTIATANVLADNTKSIVSSDGEYIRMDVQEITERTEDYLDLFENGIKEIEKNYSDYVKVLYK